MQKKKESLVVVFIFLKITYTSVCSPVSVEESRDEFAMIHLSVYDYDVLTANDFGGEAFYSLSSVPGNSQPVGHNSYVGNFHGLKQIHLPLTFQHDKGKCSTNSTYKLHARCSVFKNSLLFSFH